MGWFRRGVERVLRGRPPWRTAEDVAAELVAGLRDGSITLGGPDPLGERIGRRQAETIAILRKVVDDL